MIKIAIDQGGTFTDIYAIVDDKTIYTKKILSSSLAYEDANSYGIKLLLKELNRKYSDIEWVHFGTTVATNALLERKGADVSFLVTKGFKDILNIRYQNRDELFALNIKKPKPLYKEVIEIDERIEIKDSKPFVAKKLKKIGDIKYKSVALTLLHSDIFDKHEKIIAKKLDNFDVSLSSEIAPVIKAIDRADTTVVDAYLTPVIREYQRKILENLLIDSKKIYFMKSDGTLCKKDEFRGVNSLLSGPAGGVVALSNFYKDEPIIGFDMGGTSSDVSRYDGEINLLYSLNIAGYNISSPMVDIHTVAAGGGSRLFYKNGMFIVGPKSSGSEPGPVCYAKGGYLSVTDANLVTGRLYPDFLPPIFGKKANESLDAKGAKRAFEMIAKEVKKSVEEVAYAFIDVANEQMANAIKEITIKKGYDPKEHTLCVFGGAGGQHAVEVARKLGIKKILIPYYGGILSAVGIANAKEGGVFVKTYTGSIEDDFKSLEKRVPKGFDIKRSVLAKYKGTNTTFEVSYENYIESFKKRHKEMFGFLLDSEIEIESLKIYYFKQPTKLIREEIDKGVMKAVDLKPLFTNGRWYEAKVYKELKANNHIQGPALLVLEHTVVVVDINSYARIDEFGDIYIEVEEKEEREQLEAAKLTLLSNRLMFIAKKMGDLLQKSAKSVNIKERADFSCAIFDSRGDLIVNAPHIPVHLGSMSSVVKSIIKKGYKDATYITNVPYEGGSHLPDITIVTPYIENQEALFWVASRGHHSDIGGIVPGSMPPFSKWLSEEGAIIESFEIVEDGVFKELKLREILKRAGGRNIEDNISDIKAQIFANKEGIKELLDIKRDELLWFFSKIKRVSAKRVGEFLSNISYLQAKDFLDNGALIDVRIYPKGKRVVFDFSSSSSQLLGNQNTPYSVLRSSVLYALRTMLDEDIPLNEGLLELIEIRVAKESLLNPNKEVGVVGGNVTTSQRIVDVIFKAFKVAAASQGCMNNVTFGNKNFGYYETIGGGAGATSSSSGASGVHTHMTNTKITDVEVIERRYPVVIEEFSLRRGSGGAGSYRGGEGLVRRYRFKEEVDVSLLTERRSFAPYGMMGGRSGMRGENHLVKDGRHYNLGGKSSFKAKAGDVLIVKTPGGGGWGEEL